MHFNIFQLRRLAGSPGRGLLIALGRDIFLIVSQEKKWSEVSKCIFLMALGRGIFP